MLDNVNRSVYNNGEAETKEMIFMATTPTQVRIDADVKKAATDLFDTLGLDMSSAVNLFLHQCVLRGGLPFTVEMPQYAQKTLAAMAEAKRISSDQSVPGYSSMDELKAALDS